MAGKFYADVDSFCLHQILMLTTFSRRSLEAQGVLVLKVNVLNECKKLWETMLFIFWEHIIYWLFSYSFQHLDQEISSSSLVNWRSRLPKQLLHQDFSITSTPPDPPCVFNDLTDSKSDCRLCHWLNECNPMTTCNKMIQSPYSKDTKTAQAEFGLIWFSSFQNDTNL